MMQSVILSKKKECQSNTSHNVKQGQNKNGSTLLPQYGICQICSSLNALFLQFYVPLDSGNKPGFIERIKCSL